MTQRITGFLAGSILLISFTSTATHAQWTLERDVLGNGGGAQIGEGFLLGATCGQPAVGIAAGDDLLAEIGFWHSIGGESSTSPSSRNEEPDRFALARRPGSASAVQFSVPHLARVRIAIYGVTGRLLLILVDGEYPAGRYEAEMPASGWSSGIYFCRLTAEGRAVTMKLLLIRS